MFHRPLIPALLVFIAGIITGRTALPDHSLLFPLFIIGVIVLLVSILSPSGLKFYGFLIFFFILGIFQILTTNDHSSLLKLAKERAKVIIEGTVLTPPHLLNDISRFEIKTERLFKNKGIININENISVTVYKNAPPVFPGQRIRFPVNLREFYNFNNPGSYNYKLGMEIRRLSCSGSIPDGRYIVPMGKGSLPFPHNIIEKLKRPVRDHLREKLPPPTEGLYRALIIGEKQGISPETRQLFNITGLGHVLAVSGLHIGMIAWVSFFIFKWALSLSYRLLLKKEVRRIAAVLTCLPVVAYTCLAGFQISSQRAMIMVVTYLFSILLGREKDTWSTLALAAFLVLAFDPGAVFSISFQFSFAAVIGILWFAPVIHNFIPDPFRKSGKKNIIRSLYLYFTGLTAASVSVLFFLLPFMAFYFHQISIISIPANIMVIPLLGLWILPLGLISSLFIHVFPSFADFLIGAGAAGMGWLMKSIQFWAQFKWAYFWIFTPNVFEIVLFYSFILFAFFMKHRTWVKAGLILIGTIALTDISYWIYETRFNRDLKVTYLDVGQGNAALTKLI